MKARRHPPTAALACGILFAGGILLACAGAGCGRSNAASEQAAAAQRARAAADPIRVTLARTRHRHGRLGKPPITCWRSK